MKAALTVALALAGFTLSSASLAQRTDDNVTAQSDDAFGRSVGDERKHGGGAGPRDTASRESVSVQALRKAGDAARPGQQRLRSVWMVGGQQWCPASTTSRGV